MAPSTLQKAAYVALLIVLFGTATGWLGGPFRLIGAIGSWLNMFSVRYTGKPLNSAGGPKTDTPDLRQMMMLGNLIELQFGQGRNWPLGAALSLTLLVIVMLALIFYVRSVQREDR